jgi:Ala-tRNA(Pro) deacylase
MPTQTLKELLETHRVEYVVIRHPPEYTAQEIAAAAHIPGRQLAKTVVAKVDGEVIMAVLPAHRRLDLARLKKAARAKRAELASEADFKTLFPDCELGAVPPFGSLYAMRVFVDESLPHQEEIAVSGGSHTERVRLAYRDFERIVRPTMAELSAGP